MAELSKKTLPYSRKIYEILELFEQGKSREEVASLTGYSNYRSMDVCMRRKGFTWDPQKQKYIKVSPDQGNQVKDIVKPRQYIPIKTSRIISDFEQENADPLTIAKNNGFKDHFELAEYMRSQGFIWSPSKGNYVKEGGQDEDEDNFEGLQDEDPAEDNDDQYQDFDKESLKEFLIFLKKHENKLRKYLEDEGNTSEIPRYTLPGRYINKSVYISDALEDVVNTFSRERNLKQKEIFEVALIQFFRRYGYKKEIDRLLSIR